MKIKINNNAIQAPSHFVGAVIIYLLKNCHNLRSNGPLIIDLKLKAKELFAW
jgi:hypothetical protein